MRKNGNGLLGKREVGIQQRIANLAGKETILEGHPFEMGERERE